MNTRKGDAGGRSLEEVQQAARRNALAYTARRKRRRLLLRRAALWIVVLGVLFAIGAGWLWVF